MFPEFEELYTTSYKINYLVTMFVKELSGTLEINFHLSGDDIPFYFGYANNDKEYKDIINTFKLELKTYINQLSYHILEN